MLQQNKKITLIALLLCITVSANTEITVNPFNTDRFENKEKPVEKPIMVEPFCRNLSQNVTWWQLTAEKLQKIKNNGLGYSELIKVILISKKIEKSPEEIIKRRNRGETFLKISERYKFDYSQIKNETKKIMSDVKTYGAK